MCSRYDCNQQAYYESDKGECYYHWKVTQGLINDPPVITKQKYWKTKLFNKYSELVGYVVGKTKGVTETDKADLSQELYLKLWLVTQQIDTSLDEKQIYNYILTTLLNKVKDIKKQLDNNNTVSLDETIPMSFDLETITIDNISKETLNNILNLFIKDLSSEDEIIFRSLHVTDEEIVLRDLSTQLKIPLATLFRRDRKLFEQFKEFVAELGYTSSDFF